MLNRIRSRQGFTLIELLIVVAIIGILAAIAIPQFSSYRQKGFNSAAVSDIKNAKTAEESLFADHQTYGRTQAPATLAAATGVGGLGTFLTGATPAAGTVFAIAGIKADATVGVVSVGVSNGVQLNATTMTDVASSGNAAYVLSTKHAQGTRAYAAESGATAIMYVENVAWAGQALNVPPTGLVGIPVLATTAPSITTATAGGGVPVATWSAL